MSLNRWKSFFTASLLIAAGAFLISRPRPTVAQYGGGSHTHNWSAEPLLVKPTLAVNPKYWRVGKVVPLNVTPATPNDYDTCQILTPMCPFTGGTAGNTVEKTQWSDGVAGGQFGKMVGDQFQTCPAKDVTHYKTPDTPQVVSITVTWDDVATATEPNTNPPQTINTADDPAKTSDPEKFTVWDFTIEGPAAGWRPQGGAQPNSATLALQIRPAADHQTPPMPMNATVEVALASSRVPGYCMNRQYADPNVEILPISASPTPRPGGRSVSFRATLPQGQNNGRAVMIRFLMEP